MDARRPPAARLVRASAKRPRLVSQMGFSPFHLFKNLVRFMPGTVFGPWGFLSFRRVTSRGLNTAFLGTILALHENGPKREAFGNCYTHVK